MLARFRSYSQCQRLHQCGGFKLSSVEWPKPTRNALIAFYGDPDANNDGQPGIAWEAQSLTFIEPPYPMFWSWSGQPAKRLRVHKKIAAPLSSVLHNIGSCLTTGFIKDHHLDQCGGAYTFRLMRGGNSLSMHSYGCAIDLAPDLNPMGKKWREGQYMMPETVVYLFKQQGAKWGGNWQRADAMHFEWTA